MPESTYQVQPETIERGRRESKATDHEPKEVRPKRSAIKERGEGEVEGRRSEEEASGDGALADQRRAAVPSKTEARHKLRKEATGACRQARKGQVKKVKARDTNHRLELKRPCGGFEKRYGKQPKTVSRCSRETLLPIATAVPSTGARLSSQLDR